MQQLKLNIWEQLPLFKRHDYTSPQAEVTAVVTQEVQQEQEYNEGLQSFIQQQEAIRHQLPLITH